MTHHLCLTAALTLAGSVQSLVAQTGSGTFASHPALRPMPEVSQRPIVQGPGFYVDPVRGKDDAAGNEQAPWRTVNHAMKQLSAGDTLYLRGGVYREHVYCAVAGKPDAPITIRAYPGERVIIDGSLAEFFDEPAKADRKSTRLNSSHIQKSRMPSSA